MYLPHAQPDDSLATVAYLAGSPTRLQALLALDYDDEGGTTLDRRALQSELGVSSVTVRRLLGGFVDRGWVRREGGGYRTTPVGRTVAGEFESVLTAVDSLTRLASIERYLPNSFDVDLARLLDAEIVVPSVGDPFAPVRRTVELMREVGSVRGVGAGIAPEALRANRDAVRAGQTFEVVFSNGLLDVVAADPRMAAWMRELLDAGATVYSHRDVDLLTAEFDGERILLGVADDSGTPMGVLVSDDAMVRDWFVSEFEQYLTEATVVDFDRFIP